MLKLLLVAGLAILSSAKVDCSNAGDAVGSPSTAANSPPSLSDKASIDCTKAGSTVAKILCGSRDGAKADWDLNSTLWALAGTLAGAPQKAFDQDQIRWRSWLNSKCLQPQSGGSDISQEQQRCVIDEFHSRADKLRSQLTGDGLTESKLTPEQHAQIQESLIARDLLRSPADGEFGSSTRQAITKFQEVEGVPQTGFLSSEQASKLRTTKLPSASPVGGTAWPSPIVAVVDCPRLLSNPLVRAASVQAVAEMRKPNAIQGLSEKGLRMAIIDRIRNLLYERNQFFAQAFLNQIPMTQTETAYACLPDLMPLIADFRKVQDLQNKAAEAAAVEAAKPENQLFRAYRLYAFIKYCNELRQGYVMIYINDVEMDRAREKIEGIEKDSLAAINDKDFDTTALFGKAVTANRGLYANYQSCHFELSNLFKIKSSDGNFVIKKDF
jgi:peptidoglycan hydrolase-like protein with peptidoglycan-binding domain/uncharacterized protein YecT (DUF1311 family)